MAMKQMDIVQAEFYLTGLDAPTLYETVARIVERQLEGSRSKLVVRLYDRTGFVGRAVKSLARLKHREEKDFARMAEAGKLERWLIVRRNQHRARHIVLMKKVCLFAAQTALMKEVNGPFLVAIEPNDLKFRMLERNEGHEILETSMKAEGVWIFLFEGSGDLTADKLDLIASTI